MSDILEKYNVSRETINKLKKYESLVKEWNNKFNLVSKSSVEELWHRHIIDSLQLIQFIQTSDKILYDFGSGAGFPAIVLAIASEQLFPKLRFNLVESIGKKTIFLNTVKNELNLQNVEIWHNRIEKLKIVSADIISSRALAALPKLLEYAKPFCTQNTRLIFPKGVIWEEEIKAAKEKWSFDYDVIQSITDETGHILNISNVRRKKW